MKRLFLLCCLFISTTVFAQQYNNEWIDLNKTYYKFKVGSDSLYRITGTTLSNLGLGSVPAQDFQLWRNGKEVRIYTSVASGPLSATDYIEFWGLMNDGEADTELYKDPETHLNKKVSLHTDTAAYFLTVNPGGNNLRYVNESNGDFTGHTPDLYFMRTVERNYRIRMNRGLARDVTEYVYSSAYDIGEGWTSNEASPCCDVVMEFTGLNVYTLGPANSVSLKVNAAGNAFNVDRDLKIRIFNNEVYRQPMTLFSYKKVELNNLPLSLMQSVNSCPIYVNGTSANANDKIVVASISLTYPARYVFNNQKFFSFEVLPSTDGNFLQISSFNHGNVPPVLYDQTNGKRYVGDISTPTLVRFMLPPSAEPRKMILVSQESNAPFNVTSFQTRNFTNYALASNQGNYLIISHPVLYNDGNGNNYVDQYRQYRSSTSGGGYQAKVYNIEELTDQFAFGIKQHPGAIRNFVMYSRANFTESPQYVLLIGRGMNYVEFRNNENRPLTSQINLVPTFGWPASDVLLTAAPGTTTPLVPIGRIAAVTGSEIANYLDKVIEYEEIQQNPAPTISENGWLKNVLHVAGGKDSAENALFVQYMNQYAQIIRDTLYGGAVETFSKTATSVVQQENNQRIRDIFQSGVGFIGYFGHSSANTFEFNLSDPEQYNNAGKYPFFNVSGCSAGDFYVYDPLRMSGNKTISEKYVLAQNRGSIAFLADTHFGIPPFLNFYNNILYEAIAKSMYGNTIGNQIQHTIRALGGDNPNVEFLYRIHLEEITLHGDPAIKVNYFEKPDYVIEDQLVQLSPSIITVADQNFDVKIKMRNLGKATGDSMRVLVQRILDNGTTTTLYDEKILSVRYIDSITLTVPINPLTDKGRNRISISLDADFEVDELFENNNTLIKEFYIFEDELRPIYPYNYAIVNQPQIKYVASTANPLSGLRQYSLEIDTTRLFNSPFKQTYQTTGVGGLIEFQPTNINYTNNTVYYWRVAMIPQDGSQIIWNDASFVYLSNSTTGYNQSHYYQHTDNHYDDIYLDADRQFKFDRLERSLNIKTGLYPYYNYDRINVNLDFNQLEIYGCIYNTLQIYVFDSTTLTPWRNITEASTGMGRFGSNAVCANSATPLDPTRIFFEFPYNNPMYRKNAMDFLDMIPDGYYVAITNLGNKNTNNVFIQHWKDDTLALGSGNSLYHKFREIGFTEIDSFYHNLPFLYFYQKGVSSYTPTQVVGPQDSSHIDMTFMLYSKSIEGKIESPLLGPAKEWNRLQWDGFSIDPDPTKDTSRIEVWGVTMDGIQTQLATVYQSRDTTIEFIDADIYPFVKLKMVTQDESYGTPYQLDYWRLLGTFVPEGAVAPNLAFHMADTVLQGQPLEFSLAFKNVSEVPFDSLLKVKLLITDRNNQLHSLPIPQRKALVAGDTLMVTYDIETFALSGLNTLFIEFNPDNHQREQHHYNNILYKQFFVKEDRINPLLDVTFDGVHILNRDIIASKPNITIKLKDENRFLALRDTALLQVLVRFPDETTPRRYYFNDTMRFIPANPAAGENTATIEFKPYFEMDGEYELIVMGRDVAGNTAGSLEYRVLFNVINKPMISNLLNYPNPFTTSTAFVFTITGSEVPQNIRIQIMTVTGKIVREITKEELGPLHIGRNITTFKWDGTDMYGQKLANGVYLYRVLTNHHGKKLDKYRAKGDNTDKYFNKGYGKMYLMR